MAAQWLSDNPDGTYTVQLDDGTTTNIAKMPGADPQYDAIKSMSSGVSTGLPQAFPTTAPSTEMSTDIGTDSGLSAPIASTPQELAGSTDAGIGQGTVLAPPINLETPQSATPSAMPQNVSVPAPMFPTVSESTVTSGSSGKQYAPGALAGVTALAGQIADAQTKAGDIGKNIGTEEGAKLKAQSVQRDQQIANLNTSAEAAKDLSNSYNEQLGILLKDYQDTNITPRGIFEDDNLGQNIGAGIAIALGALGGALSGSNQNVALQIFDKAIERDLEAQKANLGKKREAISVLGIKYQAARQAGMDEEAAKSKVFAETYAQIGEYFDAKKATLSGDLAKANAEAMSIKTKEEAAKYNAEATARTIQNQVQTQTKVDTSKLAPQVTVPEGDRTTIQNNQKMIRQAERLKAIIEARQMGGFTDNAVIAFKNKFDISPTPEEAEFAGGNNQIGEYVLHSLSGTAASEAQSKRIASFLPKTSNSPEVNLKQLDRLINDSNMENAQIGINYGMSPGTRDKSGFIFPGQSGVAARNDKAGFIPGK